jgi:UDP-N-acetylglucosamine 2-epimerase (non-hydrolysing)/GDP/UDP-N,N'-diacetylbacillosamine 2-epimerase (hydrolysing)
MKPMLRMMRSDPKLALQLVVTDQHLSDRFGRTEREVEQEFAIAAAIDMRQADASPESRARALGTCLEGMAGSLADLRPDICVLYGDRGEVLATALAATTLNIPIAHIQGGDVSGSLDDPMRHAVTKLAHLHFPSTELSAERIRGMGEEPWRIHVVGDSHIDPIVAKEYLSPDEVLQKLSLDRAKPIVVVLQHSETTAPEASYDQMIETLAAVRGLGHQAVVVHPCSDAGYDGVIRAIKEIAQPPQFRVHINLDAPVFWGLLSIASVLVGNSSAGLIEAPTFRLPAVNVGRRQTGRQCAENVLHVAHDRAEIRKAI